MLCRQVIPDKKNRIEQIYIIKSAHEPESQNTTDALAGGPSMDPEDVEVKQEPPSDDDEQDSALVPSAANLHFSMMDVIIKEEPGDSGELHESGEAFSVGSTSAKRVITEPSKQEVIKRGESDSETDPEIEDSGSDWSERNENKAGRKSILDKAKSDDGSSSDSGGVMDPEPIPSKVGENKTICNKRKRHPEDPSIRQNVIKRFACHYCPKKFASRVYRARHAKVHEKPSKCETCGKVFRDAYTLTQHRQIHIGVKPFSCHCGLSFRKIGGLTTHQRKCDVPENLGSCSCRFCQVLLTSYVEMIRHIQEVHAPDMKETMCRFCPVRFKDAVQLATHELRHELPGVIQCNQCTRIFKTQVHLDLHMPAHKTEHMCHVCGKVFPHNGNLRIHMRVHSDKRPHVCDLCSKTFKGRTYFRQHRLSHYKLTGRNYIPGLVDDTVVEIEDDKENETEEIVVENYEECGTSV